jgi:hypothetical protein
MIDPAPIRDRFTALSPHLNERDRRLFAATEAAAAGYGGIAAVSAATGIAVSTIGRGLKDLAEAGGLLAGRVRRAGGGRKPLVVRNPGLLCDLLKAQKFSLQANRKTNEGGDRPDRDAQFSHINQSVTAALAAQEPVISVDTKKKELVGDFKNAGREWRPQGQPEEVRVHDFLIKDGGERCRTASTIWPPMPAGSASA